MQLHEALARAMTLGGFRRQVDLADAVTADGGGKLTQGPLSEYLRGKVRPDAAMIERIAWACEVRITVAGPGRWSVNRPRT